MPSRLSLLEFRIPDSSFSCPDGRQKIKSVFQESLETQDFHEVCDLSDHLQPPSGIFIQYLNDNGSHATVRGHIEGLVTVDIQEYSKNNCQVQFTPEIIDRLEELIKKELNALKSKRLPAIERGSDVDRYYPTADGLLMEYDFDRLVFEKDSPYQNVKIMHSKQFGNVLILDNDPNLAESDLAYTHAITGDGRDDYRDKTVLILGGGDGGILHELLKEKPKFITMVDEVVINSAKQHLRGICGDSLDKLEGENYKVLVEDCVPVLEQYVKEGKTFDFIINDLTAIPVTTKPVGDLWNFLRLILNLSMKVLSPTGKYYTQGNSANMTESLALYEEQLQKLETPVEFRKWKVCVPSYHEMWMFYDLWKKRR